MDAEDIGMMMGLILAVGLVVVLIFGVRGCINTYREVELKKIEKWDGHQPMDGVVMTQSR